MGIFLLVPFFLIRFGLLSILNKEAVRRAAFFAPLSAGEKGAYGYTRFLMWLFWFI